jgi:hypothetical protein
MILIANKFTHPGVKFNSFKRKAPVNIMGISYYFNKDHPTMIKLRQDKKELILQARELYRTSNKNAEAHELYLENIWIATRDYNSELSIIWRKFYYG